MHISFYTTRGWIRQVIPGRAVQWSIPWVVCLPCPIKVPVCGFSPSFHITLNPLTPCSSLSFRSHKCNNYGKATHIVSSNLCLFTCPQARDFPWNPYPQRHISAKSVSQIHIPVSSVNFSNNVSIPQVRVNIKKTVNMSQFSRSCNYHNPQEKNFHNFIVWSMRLNVQVKI